MNCLWKIKVLVSSTTSRNSWCFSSENAVVDLCQYCSATQPAVQKAFHTIETLCTASKKAAIMQLLIWRMMEWIFAPLATATSLLYTFISVFLRESKAEWAVVGHLGTKDHLLVQFMKTLNVNEEHVGEPGLNEIVSCNNTVSVKRIVVKRANPLFFTRHKVSFQEKHQKLLVFGTSSQITRRILLPFSVCGFAAVYVSVGLCMIRIYCCHL